MTIRNVRARYRNGVLEPLDDIDLAEDQVVLLTLDEQTVRPATDPDGLLKSAGAWADMFDDPDQLIRDVYQARIDGSREPPNL